MTEEKLCPKSFGVEILNDNSAALYGAPCIKNQCMAWRERGGGFGWCSIYGDEKQ